MRIDDDVTQWQNRRGLRKIVDVEGNAGFFGH
jgi:hypothetical protein